MIRRNCDENIRPHNFDPMEYVIQSGEACCCWCRFALFCTDAVEETGYRAVYPCVMARQWDTGTQKGRDTGGHCLTATCYSTAWRGHACTRSVTRHNARWRSMLLYLGGSAYSPLLRVHESDVSQHSIIVTRNL